VETLNKIKKPEGLDICSSRPFRRDYTTIFVELSIETLKGFIKKTRKTKMCEVQRDFGTDLKVG
jgi:hypothetical protein